MKRIFKVPFLTAIVTQIENVFMLLKNLFEKPVTIVLSVTLLLLCSDWLVVSAGYGPGIATMRVQMEPYRVCNS